MKVIKYFRRKQTQKLSTKNDPPVRREIIKLLVQGKSISEITNCGYNYDSVVNMSFRWRNTNRWNKEERIIFDLLKQGFSCAEIAELGLKRRQVQSAIRDYDLTVALDQRKSLQEHDIDPIPNSKIILAPQLIGDNLERYKRCLAYRDLFKRPGKIDFEHWKKFVNYKGK